jgi:hypothetical protein
VTRKCHHHHQPPPVACNVSTAPLPVALDAAPPPAPVYVAKRVADGIVSVLKSEPPSGRLPAAFGPPVAVGVLPSSKTLVSDGGTIASRVGGAIEGVGGVDGRVKTVL